MSYLQNAQDKTSPDTMIRSIRKVFPPIVKAPKIIGLDDRSMRKGERYGTLIVDLEKRCPIDVLPERTAECVEKWLKPHPTIKVVGRDLYHEYKKGIQTGAPKATQITDRWHLLKNNTDMLQRICAGFSQELQTVADQLASLATHSDGNSFRSPSNRQQVCDEVKELIAEGHSDRAIAKMMPVHRSTVAKYRQLDVLPEICPRKMHKAAPFEKYILQRW